MTDGTDFNSRLIEEFRLNKGCVGGRYEGSPVVLVHHRGRKSGRQYVSPMLYLPDDNDADTIYVFASNGGALAHPDWYYNLISGNPVSVEVGADAYDVSVEEIVGVERERIYAWQAKRYPRFANYQEQNDGIRTIPVLALTRRA